MFSRDELLAQARRRYPGFLSGVTAGNPFAPIELRIGKTRRAATYTERVAELAEFRAAAASLYLSVEWRGVNDPRFGTHERPESAFFANETAFLNALGKTDEVSCFRADLKLIREQCPSLETWLLSHSQELVTYHSAWPALLRVVQWFSTNPRAGVYLRQIPVSGVDTKFFEQYLAILDALLLHVQPETIDVTHKRFEARHGLRWEQPLVRLRFLDPVVQAAHRIPVADLAIPLPSFRVLPFYGCLAIIIENLRNFLALPPLPNAIAIFGSGDAASLLTGSSWLEQARILYWGDMDARGYAILSRLRSVYPSVESVMMDIQTLTANQHLAGQVPPYCTEVSRLTPAESVALKYIGEKGLWLEQERVPFKAVVEVFEQLITAA